ncbi:MAG: folylpolyglutamate synthase/dihydrofolate synthase family protein [Alphaproteobacteria bacterium]|nr:folylpolyglutamate synthase/dihydrofolate synthase family protein [Alphaproteobacteria bacterium]MDP6517181.1 folylpolyglutamate synthase/dihydrofolate synthase family protein [Alphaproteobacteria bacterium]
MAIDAVLRRLERLYPRAIDLDLGRIRRLLSALDHPERRLPPVVHVAGTNGKGSVVAFLRAMLEAAGHRVHAYTSPHLIRFTERIRLAGRLIEDEALERILAECEAANGDKPITFFEITTAAAFCAFARAPGDVVLLETGLGGRLDATNMVDTPMLTAITPISLDHQHYLGDELTDIAAEKAAILKPGVTGVIGPQPADAMAVVEAEARRRGTPLLRYGASYAAHATEAGIAYRSAMGRLDLPAPALFGPHQIENAAMAVACAESFEGLRIPRQALAAGVSAARWPARLQRLGDGRLAGLLPERWELWLDGGHNPAAAAALAESALTLWPDRPLYLVLGMMARKTPEAFLAPLAPLTSAVWTLGVPGEANALPAGDLAQAAGALGLEATVADGLEDALRAIAAQPGPAQVLICGSLYLAGAALRANGTDILD